MGDTQQSQAALLRESLAGMVSQGTELPERFFRRLFDANTGIRQLFGHTDVPLHYVTFVAALDFVVRNLDQRAVLERTLRELGVRHVRYGALPDYFADFGDCLLRAMAEVSGPRWSMQLELAWRTLFEQMAEIMLDGASDFERSHETRIG